MKQKKFTGVTGYTIADTQYQYEESDKTPEGAPNIVYIVLDDLGFAQLGCYGSTIHTPNLDKLANEGLRYNNFHTTAICSATRASLLTGMNHHTAGICGVVEHMTGCDNGIGHLHKDCATLAEILKEYDYGTYAVGKWHLTDISETTEAGPFENWPLGKGFDKYYGFLHAQMDQFHPRLFRDNSPVEQPKLPEEGYHFSEDITDNAIKYIYHQHAAYPEKPFFLYVAYGAMHTPHHAPQEYIDKYKGKFDDGWDAARQKWFARQKELGVIPQDAELTERNEFVQPWETLSEKQKKTAARYMEAFAGMLEHTDAQIGRLLDYLEEIHELDNTVVVFLSDNGASAEGGTEGSINNFRKFAGASIEDAEEEADYVLSRLDDIGTPRAFNHYPIGWAHAGNTPFPWYKIFTYSGGVKDPLIIRYPKLIKDAGSVRSQYHHVSDITPTMLDIIGVKKPEYIKGEHQRPFQGISLKYTFADGSEKDRRHVQYYEMLGNRAIYKDGWKAIVNHSRNADLGETFEADVWELYHVAKDYSESRNVAGQYPEKVRELEREWLIEASAAGVFPMFNGTMYGSEKANDMFNHSIRRKERFDVYENILEPFDLIRGLHSELNENSHIIRAELTRENTAQQGVIIAMGNYHGGFSLYIKNNRLKYTYNCGSQYYYEAESCSELPAGKVNVEYRFKVKKKSAVAELFINGEKTAETTIPSLNYFVDFITTVGANKNTPVAPMDYQSPFTFEGKLEKVSVLVDGHVTSQEKELEAFFKAD
ncbi:MAG: arylsulfatase [Clostridiaceae bacterium]|nr:arylsulfatase [Clostridiaceae bacterium]